MAPAAGEPGSAPPAATSPGDSDHALDLAANRFLVREAALLDDRRYDEWMDLLADDFSYRIPLPLVREDPRLPRYSDRAVLFEATKRTLGFKTGRVGDRSAWSDRPQNLTRRFVGNVATSLDGDAELTVRSNLLLASSPPGGPPSFVTAGRVDRVRVLDGGRWLLNQRIVHLDVEVPTGVQLSTIF